MAIGPLSTMLSSGAEALEQLRVRNAPPQEGVGSLDRSTGTASPDLSDFGRMVERGLDAVSQRQQVAETASVDFADGRQEDLHGTMIQLSQAEISLRLAGSVRNKVIEAYREIMRMGA